MARSPGASNPPRRRADAVQGAIALLFASLLCLALSSPLHAGPPRLKGTENEIKSAYLYNFALFTKWPPAAFPATTAPFVFAFLGEDLLAAVLEKSLAEVRLLGRPVKIIRAPSGSAPPDCQILYIAASEKNRIPEILAGLRGKPVLTVSDFAPFCRLGGSIRFERGEKNVSLIINRKSTEKHGLTISSDLLAIARIVETDPRP